MLLYGLGFSVGLPGKVNWFQRANRSRLIVAKRSVS